MAAAEVMATDLPKTVMGIVLRVVEVIRPIAHKQEELLIDPVVEAILRIVRKQEVQLIVLTMDRHVLMVEMDHPLHAPTREEAPTADHPPQDLIRDLQ